MSRSPAGIFDDAGNYNNRQHRSGVAAGDIDGNGYLDIVAGMWQPENSIVNGHLRLFRNLQGTFIDISSLSPIGAGIKSPWQSVMHDFDGDGLTDIFVAVDFRENELWINQGDLTFIDQAAAASANGAWNEMGVSFGDFDSDGDFDLYITNIFRNGRHNRLYRNDSTPGTPAFDEVSQVMGVDDGGWGWGTTFLDVDNNGTLDLAETNGWLDWSDSSRLFLRQEGEASAFVDDAPASGFADDLWGSGLVAFDADRDGDLDHLQSCNRRNGDPTSALRLLENQLEAQPGSNNGYLVVKPRMAGPNHRAIGAVVRAHVGDDLMMRLITAGTSFLSQEPAEAFFGLGTAPHVDRLEVRWPGGEESIITHVTPRQVLTVPDHTILFDGFENGDLGVWSSF